MTFVSLDTIGGEEEGTITGIEVDDDDDDDFDDDFDDDLPIIP